MEYWDIWSGEKYKIENCEKTEHGTIVNMPKGKEEFQIIVFTPRSNAQIFKDAETESIKLADKWECEIVPVLDNRFGDYHYPGTKEKLRPEIRHYNYILSKEKSLKEAKLLAENGKVQKLHTPMEMNSCTAVPPTKFSAISSSPDLNVRLRHGNLIDFQDAGA